MGVHDLKTVAKPRKRRRPSRSTIERGGGTDDDDDEVSILSAEEDSGELAYIPRPSKRHARANAIKSVIDPSPQPDTSALQLQPCQETRKRNARGRFAEPRNRVHMTNLESMANSTPPHSISASSLLSDAKVSRYVVPAAFATQDETAKIANYAAAGAISHNTALTNATTPATLYATTPATMHGTAPCSSDAKFGSENVNGLDATLDASIGAQGVECRICMERRTTHIAIPCGHYAYCGVCAQKFNDGREPCPVCRKPAQFIRVYAT
jgi:hypothetical protein